MLSVYVEYLEVLFIRIKALKALVDRLSLSVGWKNGPKRALKTISFNPYVPAI